VLVHQPAQTIAVGVGVAVVAVQVADRIKGFQHDDTKKAQAIPLGPFCYERCHVDR
jgi:hypothetical protein